MTEREELARLLDPAAWEDHPPGEVFPEPEVQERYEAIFALSTAERREPSLALADAILASNWLAEHYREVAAKAAAVRDDYWRSRIEPYWQAEDKKMLDRLADDGGPQ